VPIPRPPERDSRAVAARAFARSLNILLRYVRLYGATHKLTVAQFEIAWSDLQAALPAGASEGFLLGTSESKLLLDGVPLETGAAERSFADLLSAAGISSLFFSGKTTADDLQRLVMGFTVTGTKPSAMAERLKRALGDNEGAIRVNEVRYVAQDPDTVADSLSLQLTARALGGDAERVREWLSSPEKLLQLIAAAEGSNRNPGSTVLHASSNATSLPAMQEEDWTSAMRLLAHLGKAMEIGDAVSVLAAQEELLATPVSAQGALRQVLADIAEKQPDTSDPALLVKAAEHLAIQFALERYERGEVRVNAVREMLENMSRQIESLRKILVAHELKMSRAGLVVESHADILDRQFWASVPENGKRAVLESADAWCIPPRNIRNYIAELQARDERELAASILANYAGCLASPEEDARRAVAQGLTAMADLYAVFGPLLLAEAIALTGAQLNQEKSLELQILEGAALVRLTHEASTARNYSALQRAVATIEAIRRSRPDLAQELAGRIGLSARLSRLMTEALHAPELPSALVELLNHDPAAAIRELGAQFSRATRREEGEGIVALARRLGPPAAACLTDILRGRSPAEAIAAVGLLAHLNPSGLRQWLPRRLSEWNRVQHDEVVSQIAAAAAPETGSLLVEILDNLNPLAIPRALDEIAIRGDFATLPRLLRMAEGDLPDAAPDYLQVKAIEALPAFHHPGPVPVLRQLVETRGMLGWKYPHEVRVVAAQALMKIDSTYQYAISRSGLADAELQISPLDPTPQCAWVRQRRYPRFAPANTLRGLMSTSRGRCGVVLNLVSLGGGNGLRYGRVSPGSEATLDLQWGFRRLRSKVIVRSVGSHDVSFEIADIDLDERTKLRRLLADNLRYQPSAAMAHA
jgi:hypothetical protein